jgi:hypothetical protein
MASKILLQNQEVNTDGSQPSLDCQGNSALIMASGVFDGATATIQGSACGMPFQDLRDEQGDVLSITEETTIASDYFKQGLTVRIGLTGAGVSTDVSICMVQ